MVQTHSISTDVESNVSYKCSLGPKRAHFVSKYKYFIMILHPGVKE